MGRESCDVYTLGFSNRSWLETTEILQRFRVRRLADIRTLPGSPHTPQFDKENLERLLPEIGIEYIHLRSLGGLRKSKSSDPSNAGWRNASFRSYADYMQTAEFATALEELIGLFRSAATVYVCTEAVFWRCHRALVSDALLIRGHLPCHIFSTTKCEVHRLTSFARVDGMRITYPAGDLELPL